MNKKGGGGGKMDNDPLSIYRIERGFDFFGGGTVSPNSHTDLQNSDKISARPHLECENRDKMCSVITY